MYSTLPNRGLVVDFLQLTTRIETPVTARRNQQTDSEVLFDAARGWIARNYGPHRRAIRITIDLDDGNQASLGIPVIQVLYQPPSPFVPTPFQAGILEALDGVAMRTDALAAKIGDRRRLFRHPGGLKELQENGLVDKHDRLGYYRPDAPPAELEDGPASSEQEGEE